MAPVTINIAHDPQTAAGFLGVFHTVQQWRAAWHRCVGACCVSSHLCCCLHLSPEVVELHGEDDGQQQDARHHSGAADVRLVDQPRVVGVDEPDAVENPVLQAGTEGEISKVLPRHETHKTTTT